MTSDKLIGRHEEKRLLTQYVDSGRSEFIALFGRRRVGKTFLVRNFDLWVILQDRMCPNPL